MKIVAISGSPNPESTTDRFLDLFLAGLGAESEAVHRFYPTKMQIGFCTGCCSCWFRTPEECDQQDDFCKIREVLPGTDLFIIASPLYIDGLTAPTKNVLDRMLGTMPPFMYLDHEGRTRHYVGEPKGPKALLISGCGFPEPENFAPLVEHFKAICRNLGHEYAGHIAIPAAPASAYMPGFDERAALIEEAGRIFSEQGKLPEAFMEQVNSAWIDPEEYRENCNIQFESAIKTPISFS